MSKVIRYMPELEGEEQVVAAQLMKDMTEEQALHFSHVQRQRRKDETVTLVMAAMGLFGLAGLHRFYLGHYGIGLLYLFTLGFCYIGTIVDMVSHKSLAAKYNAQQAHDVALMVKGAFPEQKLLDEGSDE